MNVDRYVAEVRALARAGAATLAWQRFVAAALDGITDDTSVLTLKGRLLKDRARQASGGEAALLYQQSASAYAEAAALRPDSYPLINAATMSLFAGQHDRTRLWAEQVLALLQSGEGPGETPYWHEASRAEALLLLGRRADAESALRKAHAHAPRAWEDQAATLRQFRAILAYSGEPSGWLDAYAPPKSAYFSGMMGIAADDRDAAEAVDGLVAASGAAFAFGALAAGADILIAEAMLRRGGQVHLILPIAPAEFRARSVEPYGGGWGRRFDAVLADAASLEIVTTAATLSLAGIEMAAAVAKGRAIHHAERLASEALSLQVVDREAYGDADVGSHILRLPRKLADPDSELEPGRALIAVATTSHVASGLGFERRGDMAIAPTNNATEATALIRKVREADPGATIAATASVATGHADELGPAMQLSRLLNAAIPGTIVTTAVAAMILKAEEPSLRIEPLGELPDPLGSLSIYAVGSDARTS